MCSLLKAFLDIRPFYSTPTLAREIGNVRLPQGDLGDVETTAIDTFEERVFRFFRHAHPLFYAVDAVRQTHVRHKRVARSPGQGDDFIRDFVRLCERRSLF